MSATHRLQDKAGRWHQVAKSTGTHGAYVSFHKGVPVRLWFPKHFVQVLPL